MCVCACVCVCVCVCGLLCSSSQKVSSLRSNKVNVERYTYKIPSLVPGC